MVIIREINEYDAIDTWLESLGLCRKDTTRGGSSLLKIIYEQLATIHEEISARCIKFGLWHLKIFRYFSPKAENWRARLHRLVNTGVISEDFAIQLIGQEYGVVITIFDATTYTCRDFPTNVIYETTPELMLCKMGQDEFDVLYPMFIEEIKILNDDDYKEKQKLLNAQKVASAVVIPDSKLPPLSMKDETTSIEEPSPLVLQTNDLSHTQEENDASLLQSALFPQMPEVADERYFTEAANYRQDKIEEPLYQHLNYAVSEEPSTTQNVYGQGPTQQHTTASSQQQLFLISGEPSTTQNVYGQGLTQQQTTASSQQQFLIYYTTSPIAISYSYNGTEYYIYLADMNRMMYPIPVLNPTSQPPTTRTVMDEVPYADIGNYRYIFVNKNVQYSFTTPTSNTDFARSST